MNRATSATGWVRNPTTDLIIPEQYDKIVPASFYPLGYTWNPITGCLNGCEYCYARKLANTRLKERYLANTNLPDNILPEHWKAGHPDPFYPRFWEDRLFQPFNDKYISQKGIFVCDMSDLFGIGIPEEWTKAVMDVIEDCPTDRFYLLTKQPQNLVKFSPFPDNCWVGVSATKQSQFSQAAMGAMWGLSQIQAKVKFLSFEPLLERVSVDGSLTLMGERLVDWVIIGSQTKPFKPPDLEWVYEIVQVADKAGIPVFLKDNLDAIIPNTTMFRTEDRKLRQELPK